MQDTTFGAVSVARRRVRAVTATAALCAATATLLLAAAAAPAAITTGPVDPASGFPFSYDDDVQGFGLGQCQDASGFCIETPRPQPDQPISVPDNYTSDGEGFWWLADAEVPNAGTGLARFAKESAFDNDVIEDGHQVSFSRIRFRFTGLIAGDTYRVTHPYGVTELVADPAPTGGGRINFTNDVGCIAPPCGAFPALANDPITAFLRWDPTVAPAAPDGYVGNASVPHRVIGSPLGTDFVRLEHVVPQPPPLPPVLELVGQTDQFLVQGKLAGAAPAPPPAPAGPRAGGPARPVPRAGQARRRRAGARAASRAEHDEPRLRQPPGRRAERPAQRGRDEPRDRGHAYRHARAQRRRRRLRARKRHLQWPDDRAGRRLQRRGQLRAGPHR